MNKHKMKKYTNELTQALSVNSTRDTKVELVFPENAEYWNHEGIKQHLCNLLEIVPYINTNDKRVIKLVSSITFGAFIQSSVFDDNETLELFRITSKLYLLFFCNKGKARTMQVSRFNPLHTN